MNPSPRASFHTRSGSARLGLAMLAAVMLATAESPAFAEDAVAPARYEATKESLSKHPLPAWFKDAKFGIFVHWGLYSIPAYAGTTRDFQEVVAEDYENAMANSPWSDDYENSMRIPGSPTQKFHREKYGSMPYEGFKPIFMRNLNKYWDPDAWAEAFQAAGAKYVVLNAKNYDGFVLWPSSVVNPNRPDWRSERDIVGELAAAVRKRGMRFGILYSGGKDSTFQPPDYYYDTVGGYLMDTQCGQGYPDYANAHIRELTERYKVDILWSDGSWPGERKAVFQMMADYYNAVPEGVINDRFRNSAACESPELTIAQMDQKLKATVKRNYEETGKSFPTTREAPLPAQNDHFDFTDYEYRIYPIIQSRTWEMDRAIGQSWGQHDGERFGDGYDSFESLFDEFTDVVSKNGNLLLNVGPDGNMQIPPEQLGVIKAFGRWLEVNGDAIYGSTPWTQNEARTANGKVVRFTRKADAVNVILMGKHSGQSVTLKNVRLAGTGKLLANGTPVGIRRAGNDTVLSFERRLNGIYSPTIVVTAAR